METLVEVLDYKPCPEILDLDRSDWLFSLLSYRLKKLECLALTVISTIVSISKQGSNYCVEPLVGVLYSKPCPEILD